MKIVTALRVLTDRGLRGQYLLSRSKDCFRPEWEVGWADHSDASLTDATDHFSTLRRDGILILPGYVSGEKLADLKSEVMAAGFTDGNYSGGANFKNFPEDGICAIELTEAMPLSYSLIAGNRHIDGIAKALYGTKTSLTTAAALSKYGADKIDSSNVPHWDDWFPRFKAFLYVFDVGPEDAPMLYGKGTHLKTKPAWRFDKDFAGRYMPNASAGGSWVPIYQDGYEFISCAGIAGTLILFDARGVHSGTQLVHGPRVMLMGMWTRHMKYHFRPY